MSTWRWCTGALLASWLACGCQIGALDVPIGSDRQNLFYVGPDGDDLNPGTREKPWKTLARATSALHPGQTLLLLNGDYRLETTGLLSVDCGGPPNHGRPGMPITVRAENERGAVLHGDGASVPLELWGCSDWVIEGLLLANEHNPDVAKGTDVGTVAMLHGGHDLTLRRLLLMRSNHDRHSHILRVLEAEHVLVEECETYDFYHNAFETVRSLGVTFRRNYFHSRYAVSAGNTVSVDDPTRGEVAIQIEESSSCVLENNVAEVVGTGFSVVGRSIGSSYTDPAPYPVSGARLYGNIVRDSLGSGFRIETRCDEAAPCTTRPERIVADTLIVNGVAIQTPTGVSVDAAPGTRVDNVTLVDVTNGVVLKRGSGNAGLEFSASAARGVVRGFNGVAFWATDAADWSFDHCSAQAPAVEAIDFSPNDQRVQLPVTAPNQDACLAYLGSDSLLRGAAGADGDVGANVLFRYQDGTLTREPLWNQVTGAFPCGAVVPGINDDPNQSCIGVHERLRVGTPDCSLPQTVTH
ncbi:MAG: right-handed parallel beta-helix repeat-containing protein [Myxococcales bacterium]